MQVQTSIGCLLSIFGLHLAFVVHCRYKISEVNHHSIILSLSTFHQCWYCPQHQIWKAHWGGWHICMKATLLLCFSVLHYDIAYCRISASCFQFCSSLTIALIFFMAILQFRDLHQASHTEPEEPPPRNFPISKSVGCIFWRWPSAEVIGLKALKLG